MRITRDTPGERLTLEGDPKPRIPAAAVGCLAVVVLPFLWTPAGLLLDLFRGEGMDPGRALALAFSALFAGLAVLTLFAPRLGRVPFRVDVDRTAGEVRLVHRRLVGGGEQERVLRLNLLRGLTVRTVTAVSRLQALGEAKDAKGKALQIELRVARDEAGDRQETRELILRVEDLDQPAEVVDFAYRLGAASGLTFAKVVRNDPKAIEVELSPTREPGFAPAPWDLAKADYAKDAVAKAARDAVAHEKVPSFEPGTFPSDHRVRVYEPRSRVVLRKPWGFAALGCLPFTLLVLTGPLVFLFARFTTPTEWPMRLFVSGFVGLFGLILGGVAMLMVHSALPRTVTFDWTSGRAVARGTGKFDLAFADIAALELRQVHRVSTSKNSTTHWHYCSILLHRRASTGEGGPTSVVETTHLRDDPDTGYGPPCPWPRSWPAPSAWSDESPRPSAYRLASGPRLESSGRPGPSSRAERPALP